MLDTKGGRVVPKQEPNQPVSTPAPPAAPPPPSAPPPFHGGAAPAAPSPVELPPSVTAPSIPPQASIPGIPHLQPTKIPRAKQPPLVAALASIERAMIDLEGADRALVIAWFTTKYAQ